MNGTQIVSILKHARERVARRWVQNKAEDPLGGVCSAQAIQYGVLDVFGVTDREQIENAGQQLLVAAREQTGLVWFNIPQWNDAEQRTQQDVLDTFDYAIKTAERDMEDTK